MSVLLAVPLGGHRGDAVTDALAVLAARGYRDELVEVVLTGCEGVGYGVLQQALGEVYAAHWAWSEQAGVLADVLVVWHGVGSGYVYGVGFEGHAVEGVQETLPWKYGPVEVTAVGKSYGEYSFPVTALGGTFDHLHAGHKMLLSGGVFLAGRTLIVGVTGHELLQKKQYAEALETYGERERAVRAVVARLSSKPVALDVYEINDVCGPTGYVEEIDALVLSGESRSGGAFVNRVRTEKGWHALEIVEIGVLGAQGDDYANKVSLTELRRREVARRRGGDE